jgi:type VI secretion system protein ImpH
MEGPPLEREAAAEEVAATPQQPAAPAAAARAAGELEAALAADPLSFAAFQAVRLLERLHPERARVGLSGDPAAEVVRFEVDPFIHFPAAEIQRLELRDDAPTRMAVNFMGLTGPLGVLPFYYTQLVADRLASRDRTLKDFLDLFHHRMISLFQRAWEKSRFAVTYERGERDRVTEHLLDLIGLGLESARGRMALPEVVLLYYAGLLAPQQRSACALQQLLEDYFDVPMAIEQFVGGWYPLAAETQCNVGGESASERLGLGAVAGDEIWDQQACVRIRVGPLSRTQYDEFLPDGRAQDELRALLRFFADDRVDFELQLVLARDEVPGCVVSPAADASQPLGWCTWIRTGSFDRDADEAILKL